MLDKIKIFFYNSGIWELNTLEDKIKYLLLNKNYNLYDSNKVYKKLLSMPFNNIKDYSLFIKEISELDFTKTNIPVYNLNFKFDNITFNNYFNLELDSQNIIINNIETLLKSFLIILEKQKLLSPTSGKAYIGFNYRVINTHIIYVEDLVNRLL